MKRHHASLNSIICILLLCISTLYSQATTYNHTPEFSTAGFFELKNSGQNVYSMNPAWRIYKGKVQGAETKTFDDSSRDVISLPNSIEYLPTEASGCINYQGEAWYRKHILIQSTLHPGKIRIIASVMQEGSQTPGEWRTQFL